MVSVAGLVILVLALVLLVAAVLLVRSRSGLPWPAIVVAALTSAVCFTVGGDTSTGSAGPSIATVAGSIAGLLSMVAAILALVPKDSHETPAPRTPILLSTAGIALGTFGCCSPW
jgi:L-lactate permease